MLCEGGHVFDEFLVFFDGFKYFFRLPIGAPAQVEVHPHKKADEDYGRSAHQRDVLLRHFLLMRTFAAPLRVTRFFS